MIIRADTAIRGLLAATVAERRALASLVLLRER